jgi:RNA polymerase sigma-70 factor (ECF subfamily)
MTEEEKTRHFYTYIWPHRGLVLRTARFLTRDAAKAEDLAQETLMQAFRKIEKLDVTLNPKGWLTSILRHLRIDQIRLRADGILTGAQDLASVAMSTPSLPTIPERDPHDLAALLEALSDQAMIDALHALPEEIRWTLLLIDVEQMSYDEAAEIMDIPAGTVKSRLHRGRHMLRDILVASNIIPTSHRSGGRTEVVDDYA